MVPQPFSIALICLIGAGSHADAILLHKQAEGDSSPPCEGWCNVYSIGYGFDEWLTKCEFLDCQGCSACNAVDDDLYDSTCKYWCVNKHGGANPSAKCKWSDCYGCADCWDPEDIFNATCSPNSTVLNFYNTTIESNNLGGTYPNSNDKPEIRYRAIATIDGVMVDLVVTNHSAYACAACSENGKSQGGLGSFGKINLLARSEVDLLFRLVDPTSNDSPVTASETHFTIFDLDQGLNSKSWESWTAYELDQFLLYNDSEVRAVIHNRASTTFFSTMWGSGCDNPSSPNELGTASASCNPPSVNQLKRSVMMIYRETNYWEARLKTAGYSDRNFLFAGESTLTESCPGYLPLPNLTSVPTGIMSTVAGPTIDGGLVATKGSGPLVAKK